MADTLTVTQSASITLGGKAISTTVTKAHSVSVAMEHYISVGTGSFVTIGPMDRGAFGYEDFKFMVITNQDATNFVTIYLQVDGGYQFHKILPGSSFCMNDNKSFNNQSTTSDFSDVEAVYAKADTAAVELKLFVAA